ncbi:MAG: DJ-1/PfpI family protein [Chitinophagaceae bacterium]|nr:DJ-1/PfpI family protein [Chitinophagaceae bacterium]
MPSTKITFLILPHTNLLDLAGASQVFFEAKEHGIDLEMEYCSFEEKLITSANLPLGRIKHYKTQKLKPGDYIFIVSADIKYVLSKELRPDKALLTWISSSYNSGVNVCSVCNGAFLLAQTGLLDGRNCTTHWKRTTTLKEKFPLANVVENVLFIEDNGIYTSAGASSGIDIALHIIGKLRGEYFSYKISRELVIYNRRSGSQEQQSIFLSFRNHMHTGVHKVQDWLQENLDKKASLPFLSDISFMSSRNLTRIFKKETGITINDYVTLLRKERIRDLQKNPDITRKQIARLCGLKSERQITRLLTDYKLN